MPFGIYDYHKSLSHLHVGCEAPRAYFVPFKDKDGADTETRDYSPYFKPLIGTWDFKFFKSVTEVPDPRITDIVFPDKLDVPMNWQNALGRGYDGIQYTNVDYPFQMDPPYIPAENPAGLYSRSFNLLSEDIENKEVMLNFEGVDSCFYLFINGEFVGYSQVAHMTSEFNVTKFVKAGSNDIKVLVLKWCEGSYLEDQDMFRASGIFREVYLLYRDRARVTDAFVKCDLSDDFTVADFSVDIEVNAPVDIKASLFDAKGELLDSVALEAESSCRVDFASLENVRLWSDEDPYLYSVLIECGNEVIKINTGARRVEIIGRVVYINGKKVKAKGVNRHDSHPILGHATPMEHMKRDLMILKRNNVNMIRTSHYPNDPRFLELCDKYGFYVCDEADLECHGAMRAELHHIITNNPEWTGSYLDRAARMLERDKNHASIIMWSVGNESGVGINHELMSRYFKERDPSRLVHVEDESRRAYHLETGFMKAGAYDVSPEHYRSYYDVESRMYPHNSDIAYYVSKKCKKPFFMCEYSHAMGNGPGDLKKYWDLIYKHDHWFGGCVWEMLDHSVATGDNIYASPKYIYGGDSGEFPHLGPFCVDGLVYPDRREHTGMKELREVLKPFRAEYANGTLKITNLRHFTSLCDLSLYVTVERFGEVIYSRDFGAMNIPKERSKSYKIAVEESGFTTLNVYVKQNSDTEWAKAGYEVGSAQFIVSSEIEEKKERLTRPTLIEDSLGYTVSVGEAVYVIGRDTGLINSVTANGKEMTVAPIAPTIWRAPTDNDRKIRNEWQYNYFDHEKTNCRSVFASVEENGSVKITADVTVGAPGVSPAVYCMITYTFGYGEEVRFDVDAKLGRGVKGENFSKLPPLPRFGFRVRMPEGSEDVRYFGYGPYESYEDKRIASKISLYKTTATDNFEHYVRPQENSSHYGCKWADVTSTAGYGLYFSGESFSFSVSHYEPHYLTGFDHDYELVPEKETTVLIDYRNAGIGSNSCGPALDEEYSIIEKEFSFSFVMKPSFGGNILPFKEYRK